MAATKIKRKKALSVGVYIGQMDRDIALWFTMLRRHSRLSYTTWVSAILAAYVTNTPIDIGTIITDRSSPVTSMDFGDGFVVYTGSGRASPPAHIDNDYEIGSIISIKITDPSIANLLLSPPLCDKQSGPFIKILIRHYLKKHPTTDIYPSDEACRDMLDHFELSCTSLPVVPAVSAAVPSTDSPVISPPDTTPESKAATAKPTNPLISFI